MTARAKARSTWAVTALSGPAIGMIAADTSMAERYRFGISRTWRDAPSQTGVWSRAVIRLEHVGHTSSPTLFTHDPASLYSTLQSLQQRVRALEAQLAVPAIIEVRDVPPAEAKRELINYFKENPGTYPSDAAMALRLDSAVVRDLCLELMEEGLLEG